MSDILDEFEARRLLVEDASYDEANARISGLYDWLLSQEEIEAIILSLEQSVETDDALKSRPPNASSPEVIARGCPCQYFDTTYTPFCVARAFRPC